MVAGCGAASVVVRVLVLLPELHAAGCRSHKDMQA